jgi:hypothetical protein
MLFLCLQRVCIQKSLVFLSFVVGVVGEDKQQGQEIIDDNKWANRYRDRMKYTCDKYLFFCVESFS